VSLDLSRRPEPSSATAEVERPDAGTDLPGIRRIPEVPRPLLLLSAAVVVVGAAVVFIGGWRTGVSWDETYHVLRMRNYLDSGWYLLDADLQGGKPGPWEDQQFVYGPAAMLLLQGWSLLWGVDGASGVAATPEAFAVRHLAIGLIAMVGVAAAASLTRLLLRSWSWGLVTAGILLALPVWAGHAMFNVKDIPVATGFTLATLGLALLVLRVELARPTRALIGGVAALTAGIVLAVGTRPGILPGLALGTMLVLVTRDWRRIVAVAVALGLAYVALLGVYPEVFSTPVTALYEGALESSRYNGAKGEWWWLPMFVLVEIPIGYLVLTFLATGLAVRGLWRRRLPLDARGTVIVLVVLQCFALPMIAIVRESNVYTGVRQMLFSAPATAILVTLGIATLLGMRQGSSKIWLRRLVPAAIALTLLGPVVAQLQLFPYSYAYTTVAANLAAPIVADVSDYEVPTDYWRTSVRELAPGVPVGGWVTCSPAYDSEGRALHSSREGRFNCATDVIGPLAAYDDLRSGTWEVSPTSFLVIETGREAVGTNCTKLADVRRWLYWRHVEMGYVAQCDLVLLPFPDDGMNFEGGAGSGNLLGGWSIHQSERGIGLREEPAELGFTLPAADAARPLTLTGTALGAEGLTVDVNGEPAEVQVDGDSFRVDVPAATTTAYGEGRVVVGFGDADGDLRVLTLRLGGTP
jgi:hypothetical protein